MTRQILMTDEDEALWIQARKFFVTASDFFNFAQLGPSYWPDRRPEILAEKLMGKQRVFGDTPEKKELAERRMEHGKFNEDNNLAKFSHYAKLRTKPAHFFMTNDRWPWLGCTLDGIVAAPKRYEKINGKVFDQADHVQAIRDTLLFRDGIGICELKQHERKAAKLNEYFGHVKRSGAEVPGGPPYSILPQIQGQMHIADFKWSLLVAQIGAIHMQAHLVERDESFAELLDDMNEGFRKELVEHRRIIWEL